MARYIEIKEAVRVVDMCFFIQGIDDDKLKNTICNSIEKNSNAIEDVAPVIHAHWTRKRTQEHDGELYCSNCEWTPEVLGVTTLGDLQLADVYYCPHCGAKMDGKEGNARANNDG